MDLTVGTIFIDSRKAAKIAKSDLFQIIDLLEIVEVGDNISLKIKSLMNSKDEWIPCHNYSEKIIVSKDELCRYVKNERFVSGSVWVPVDNNYAKIVELLNEKKIRSIDFNKDLSYEIYSSDIKNINSILEPLGKII